MKILVNITIATRVTLHHEQLLGTLMQHNWLHLSDVAHPFFKSFLEDDGKTYKQINIYKLVLETYIIFGISSPKKDTTLVLEKPP